MNLEIKPRAIYPISANPIHIGHLDYVHQIVNSDLVRGVEIVVTNVHPEKQMQASFEDRLRMTHLAVYEFFGNDERIHVSRIEETLPTPNYTSSTILKLQEEFERVIPVIGADNIPEIYYWQGMWEILKQTGAIILPRAGVEIDPETVQENMTVMNSERSSNLCSAFARTISEIYALAGYTGVLVANYISENKLYGFE